MYTYPLSILHNIFTIIITLTKKVMFENGFNFLRFLNTD